MRLWVLNPMGLNKHYMYLSSTVWKLFLYGLHFGQQLAPVKDGVSAALFNSSIIQLLVNWREHKQYDGQSSSNMKRQCYQCMQTAIHVEVITFIRKKEKTVRKEEKTVSLQVCLHAIHVR